MLKRWIVLLASLLLPVSASAQVLQPSPQAVNVSNGAVCAQSTTSKSCAIWNSLAAPTITLQVAGTFSGTLTFEATADGQNWFAVMATDLSKGTSATTTTTTGQFSFGNTGVLAIRARASAWSSGAVSLTVTRGLATGVAIPR